MIMLEGLGKDSIMVELEEPLFLPYIQVSQKVKLRVGVVSWVLELESCHTIQLFMVLLLLSEFVSVGLRAVFLVT